MNISSEEENDSSSENEEPIDFKEELAKEKQYWETYFIKNYVYMPEKCPKCKINKLTIGNKNNLISPKILICNNSKCKYRTTLRKFSFLVLIKK